VKRAADGLTLIEVLVATTVFAIFLSATASMLTLALRLHGEALRTHATTTALDPHLIAGAATVAALTPCADPPEAVADRDSAPSPRWDVCAAWIERCSIVAGSLACGDGDLVRAALRARPGVAEAAHAWDAAEPDVIVWARWGP
jgi:prepilin-type N-terminal cleavage/methylation domain-containing protein